MRTSLMLSGAAVLGLVRVAAAQVPAHATRLNPTTLFDEALVLQDGDTVHAFARGGWGMLHARSRDGGRTWPVLERPLSYAAGQGLAAAIVGSGTVLVLAHDHNAGPLCWRSTDDGTTWSPAVPLSSVVGPPSLGQAELLADGPDVVVVWSRTVPGIVRSRRSLDGGATWLPEQPLHAGASAASSALRCHRNGSVIDVLWSLNSSAVHQRSIDGGTTWLPSPRVVAGPGLLSTASDGTNLLLSLTSGTFWHSRNGGATWTPRFIPGHGYPMSIANEGLRIVVGSSGAGPAPGPAAYSFSVSSDGGLTWSPSLQLPSPIWMGVDVHLAMGVAYAVFGASPTGIVTSRDGGATWQLVGGPVNGLSPGPRRNMHLVVTGPTTNLQYHAYVGLGSSVLGSSTPGSGGIAPRLVANGLPFQGATTTLQVVDALGGTIGVLAVSFAPPSPQLFAGGTLWPTGAPVTFVFATGGTTSAPGTGSFGMPVLVPVHPSFVGLSFVSQAVVVDAAAAGGIAVSNALETWLR